MFTSTLRRCAHKSGRYMLAVATASTVSPSNNETKSADEFQGVAPTAPTEHSALRTYVVTPSREFVWSTLDTVKAAQTSFSEGFTNTTHKAASSVDVGQIREVAKTTREVLDYIPGAVTVGASALLPLLIFRRSPFKALLAGLFFGGIATSQIYPTILDTGARRAIGEYKKLTEQRE